jgi:hypothetical protein
MNVTVDQVLRSELAHEPEEALEAAVAGVLFVMDALGGGMGQEYVAVTAVENFVPDKARSHLEYFEEHLEVCVLVVSVVVAHGAFQPGDDQSFFLSYFEAHVYHAGTVGFLGVAIYRRKDVMSGIVVVFLEIMIAENKKKRYVQSGDDIFKVVHREVSGGKHQAYVGKTLLDGRRIDKRIDLVRYA